MAGDFQPRELSGSVFPNDRKTQPNHPDYRGSCLIDGKEYWVSGWLKQSVKGKFLSMAFQAKEAKPAAAVSDGLDEVPVKTGPRSNPPPQFDEDDIPF